MRILIINLGSTSSKIAVYEEEQELFVQSVSHDASTLASLHGPEAHRAYRAQMLAQVLAQHDMAPESLDAVCSRGGPLKPVPSGTYRIDENVVSDATDPNVGGIHPSCMGVTIAFELSRKYGIPAYFVDPVSTDEMIEEARYTGYRGMERRSLFHALNHKSMARKAAACLGKPYEQVNLIGLHMGGGLSAAAHQKGRFIDVFNVRDEGAFGMDRGGSLPVTDVVDLCYSGLSRDEVRSRLIRRSGVCSYLETKDFREVELRIEHGDREAEAVFRAMIYQYAKDIGALAAVMHFEVDGIFLTGGIAYSRRVCEAIKAYVGKLAPVIELPGENEMESLALGALRVLRGEQAERVYGKALCAERSSK